MSNTSYQIKLCTDLISLALFGRKNIYKFREVRKHLEFFFDDDTIDSAIILLKIGRDEE